MGKSWLVRRILLAQATTSTSTSCALGAAGTSTVPMGPISLSAGAPLVRAVLGDSRYASPYIHSAATPSLGAAEIVGGIIGVCRGTISMAPQGGRGSSPQPNDPCHLEGVEGSARGAQASLGPAYHLTAHSPHLQGRYHGPDSCTNKRGSRT
jgi:hypothetical protein